jgi:hypothetical protein
MRQLNVNVLSAANTASRNGVQIDSNQLINISFQLVQGDGVAAGSLVIQGSNDVCPVGQANSGNFVVTNWSQINTTAQAAGSSVIVQLSNVSYRWLRAVWTSTTPGTTTVNVNMFGMGV